MSLFEKKGNLLGVALGGSDVTAQARNFPEIDGKRVGY